MTMELNVGDKVVVTTKYKNMNEYIDAMDGFTGLDADTVMTNEMIDRFAGTEVTVADVVLECSDGSKVFSIEEDRLRWMWTYRMFDFEPSLDTTGIEGLL